MASKAASSGSRGARLSELGPYGITVNAISPGLTRSPGTLARAPRPGMASMEDELPPGRRPAGNQAAGRVPADLWALCRLQG